jgi:hypothetical protein
LTDTVHTTRTLNKSNDCPGQIVVDHDVGILEILSFGEHVSCDENTKCGLSLSQSAIGRRTEASSKCYRVTHLIGQHCYIFTTRGTKLLVEVQRGIGKLREDQ